MITVTDLRKAYGRNIAVDGVSFAVAPGETFGLLGPNGAGKTTTMHMLGGALRPDGGRIEIAGAADPTRARAREIGIARKRRRLRRLDGLRECALPAWPYGETLRSASFGA
jgi:ABC-type multidrug transport system ATPase subunit